MAVHTEQQDRVYSELVSLYNYAEKLLNTVEEQAQDVDATLDIVEPLIDHLSEAADILTESYRKFVETGEKPDLARQEIIKQALERLYSTVGSCRQQMQQ